MKYILNISVAVVITVALSGCDMYSEGIINENSVQVSEEIVSYKTAISDINDAFLGDLARHYTKHGGGALDVAVTYDPKSYRNTAMNATNEISDIVQSLRDYGIKNVNAEVIPVKLQGNHSYLLVSYNAFNAHAPKGCDVVMPGMNGNLNTKDGSDYKLGCSIDTMVARQIAKPAHLLGRGATDATTEGRSATNIVDVYRSGVQNKPLDGESASGG